MARVLTHGAGRCGSGVIGLLLVALPLGGCGAEAVDETPATPAPVPAAVARLEGVGEGQAGREPAPWWDLGGKILDKLAGAERDVVKIQLRQIDNAAKLFFLQNGRVPTMRELLEGIGGQPPVLLEFRNRDPWGSPYALQPEGAAGWTITCAGKDRRVGTADDARLIR